MRRRSWRVTINDVPERYGPSPFLYWGAGLLHTRSSEILQTEEAQRQR
jgi:hypothetical protein